MQGNIATSKNTVRGKLTALNLFRLPFWAQHAISTEALRPIQKPALLHSRLLPLVRIDHERHSALLFVRLHDLQRVMTCSVALDVMPHSATRRVSGDDMSTMMDSNSGV